MEGANNKTKEKQLEASTRVKKAFADLQTSDKRQKIASEILKTQKQIRHSIWCPIDINALRTNGAIPEGYAVNHFLTDTDAYFLTTDVPNGMKYFERAAIKTAMEGDFDTGNVRYKARERYSFGVSDFRGIFASPGA